MELSVEYEKAVQYESRLRYTEAKCELRNMWKVWMEAGSHYVEDLSSTLWQPLSAKLYNMVINRRNGYSFQKLQKLSGGLSITQKIMRKKEKKELHEDLELDEIWI